MSPIGSDPITVFVHIAPLRAAELATSGVDAAPTLLLALTLVASGAGLLRVASLWPGSRGL